MVGFGGRPARPAGDAVLVPAPANIRPGVAEQYGVWLQIAHELPRVRRVVIGAVVDLAPLVRAAVVAVTAVRAVEEDLEYRPIVGQQLAQLIAIVNEVFGTAIGFVIAIPRRQIDTEFQSSSRTRLRDLLHYIAPKRAVLDRMLGVARRPEAEAVVVLAGEDQPLHPAVLRGTDDLVGVKIGGIEDVVLRVAVAPLVVGKGVDGEMQKTVKLELVPG